MKIWLFWVDSEKTKKFEELVKFRWKEDYIKDLNWDTISQHRDSKDFKIYIAYEWDVVLWWCILSFRNILNNFKDPLKTAQKLELQKQGYGNLTYMIVDESLRGWWIGSKILKYVTKNNTKLWLSCLDERIAFYEKNKFKLDVKKIEGERVNLMIYSKN